MGAPAPSRRLLPDEASCVASGNARNAKDEGEVPREDASPPGAELRTFAAQAGATAWVGQTAALSVWRGEVGAADRLRVEARDGSVHEIRLEPLGTLRLGRVPQVGAEKNELVYPDVASRLAAILRHDGIKWWILRRPECSVPLQVGARALERGEEAPLVHGTFVGIGAMRATLFDRRFMSPTLPAGSVDPATGLLARGGLEQEIAAALGWGGPSALVLLRLPAEAGSSGREPSSSARAAWLVHRAEPTLPVALCDGTVAVVCAGERGGKAAAGALARRLAEAASGAFGVLPPAGLWALEGGAGEAGREAELALQAALGLEARQSSLPGGPAEGAESREVVDLRELPTSVRFGAPGEVAAGARDPRRLALLFGIEDQSALGQVGPGVVASLEQELAALVATHAGAGALVARTSPGVVVACVPRKADPLATAQAIQVDWHARPPVTDGKAELPRALSFEVFHGEDLLARSAEFTRECADPHGVLSALSGGLPFPIAGRVHAASSAASAMERVKMLFDVLEGSWRFIAAALASAYFAKPAPGGQAPPGFDAMAEFFRRVGSRDGYALGTWRELARIAAKGFEDRGDPVGALARDVLGVKLAENQTFETLSNLLHAERNAFAHGHYTEARAAKDLPEFEQMTRAFLRALRPLSAWTLVTVEKTEPDLYGEVQTVEYIDHTGSSVSGTRRKIGLNSPVRLANVVYLARFREGLLVPLEPLVRRAPYRDGYELFFMDHLPRAGACQMSLAVGSATLRGACDPKRMPPLLRLLLGGGLAPPSR